jgi:hypothetical protein
VKEKKMKSIKAILATVLFFLVPLALFASDKSDAEALMNKCEANAKITQVPVANFGDDKDKAAYEKGLGIIKQGKVKFLQSKYLDAKALFEQYLKAEDEIYAALSPKYTARVQAIIDAVAEDLVDYASKPDIIKCFADASLSLDTAKANFGKKQYPAVINSCRIAKKLVLNAYTLAKLEIPATYAKDISDSSGKVHAE